MSEALFKWDRKRGLCLGSLQRNGMRYYAIAAFGDGVGQQVVDVLNAEYRNYLGKWAAEFINAEWDKLLKGGEE